MIWTQTSLILTILVSQVAFAKSTAQNSDKPVIWTRGYYSNLKARFPASQFEFSDPASRRKRLLRSGYLMPSERDALFQKLNLESSLIEMDALNKDMLVMDTKSFSVDQLTKFYPMLTKSQLQGLKSAVEKIK